MERTAEQERARIAGELHDDTIQVLTAAGLRLDELASKLEAAGDTSPAGSARAVRDLIGRALERTRRLTFELYPPQLDQGGLPPALEALAQRIAAESSFDITVEVSCDGLPRDTEQLTYRTVKELLTNVQKHAHARHVSVAVTAEGGVVRGAVEDDGRGFDPATLADARQSFHVGLGATSDRLAATGGTLTIVSEPGHGTRAGFTLPFQEGGEG
jgi:signal transduction histidine kinase